ncbi:CHAT domain-containing tetratricopeptide repeat protein [Streptomyces flavidovirens]|uniref:CHAT domain-containing tetratricopeptide repeat protein n=1 Tax=Streptomyces flavidovirens TaxID=67298 RepID=UPI000490F375|nr:CHAT domain-containing protein [Streptomyces flavidovirens]
MRDGASVRARQLAKLTSLLQDTRRSGDASALFRSRTVRRVVELHEAREPNDLKVGLVLGWFHWFRYLALPEGADRPELQRAVDEFVPCFLVGMEELPADLLPLLAREAALPARALAAQCLNSTDPEALTAAIELCRRVVAAADERDPRYPRILLTLVSALHARFERDRSSDDLDEIINEAMKAALLSGPDDPSYAEALSLVGVGLLARYRRTGHLEDLAQAENVTRQAVAASAEGGLDRAGRMSNLSNVLKQKYYHSGNLAHLLEAVSVARDAVATVPAALPPFAGLSSNLAAALVAAFERVGRLADLDDAVTATRNAVQATPTGHPDRPMYLSNLAAALRTRYVRLGATEDLAEARESALESFGTCPPEHPHHGRFLSVSRAVHQTAYEHSGAAEHLEMFSANAFIALIATPDSHPEFPLRASEFADIARLRFEHGESEKALQESIDWSRRALNSSSAAREHPELVSRYAQVLRTRYTAGGAPSDLDEAIAWAQKAVDLATTDRTSRTGHLINLAGCLQLRAEHRDSCSYAERAAGVWREVAQNESAAPSQRIEAGLQAATLLARLGRYAAAAESAEEAVLLFPQTAARRLGRRDRQQAISRYAGLAGTAAALALEAAAPDDPEAAERAAGLLEVGRAVLLGQALEVRGDLAELTERRPELAARFRELREHLDQPEAVEIGIWDRVQPGGGTDARHYLNQELAELLRIIRSLPGLDRFGLPPSPAELRSAAAEGPIILINVNGHRSDALLITQDRVRALPLPGLTPDAVARQVEAFDRALGPTSSGESAEERSAMLAGVLQWLWDNAAGPVLTALGHTRTPGPADADIHAATDDTEWQSWPRVWWAPGGLLGTLPLHAAGHHTEKPADPAQRRTVLDRVVSSYTPTVRALHHARERARARGPIDHSAAHSLVVAMPATPGLPNDGRLWQVDDEVRAVRRHLPDAEVLLGPEPDSPSTGSPDTVPTRANVLVRLPHSAVAHFACHGTTDPDDPSRSLLLLHDHATHPLTVAQLAPVLLDRAQLAYLSACSTAVTHADTLVDEAIHLATAFQIAGYPRVIGTLWTIKDNIAVTMADLFYQGLATGTSPLDPGRSAYALHHTVRRVRDGHGLPQGFHRAATPALWAAHIHVGV